MFFEFSDVVFIKKCIDVQHVVFNIKLFTRRIYWPLCFPKIQFVNTSSVLKSFTMSYSSKIIFLKSMIDIFKKSSLWKMFSVGRAGQLLRTLRSAQICPKGRAGHLLRTLWSAQICPKGRGISLGHSGLSSSFFWGHRNNHRFFSGKSPGKA